MQALGASASSSFIWSYAVYDGPAGHGPVAESRSPFISSCQLSSSALCHDSCASLDLDSPLADGRWHHVALAWDVSDCAMLYLDGVLATVLRIPSGTHPFLPGGTLVPCLARVLATTILSEVGLSSMSAGHLVKWTPS